MKCLERYYEGDERWEQYVKVFETEELIDKTLLELCNNDKDLAQVIHFHLGQGSIAWMQSSIPALDNISPLECLKSETLTRRLRVCLMRFPC